MYTKDLVRSLAATRLSLEKAINPIANKTKIIESKCFLKCIKIKLILTLFLTIVILYESWYKLDVLFMIFVKY